MVRHPWLWQNWCHSPYWASTSSVDFGALRTELSSLLRADKVTFSVSQNTSEYMKYHVLEKVVYNSDGQSCLHIFLPSSSIWYFISSLTMYTSDVIGKITTWPAPSGLESSIGRAEHRHPRGYGLESRSGPNFFQASISQLLKLSFMFSPQFKLWSFIYSLA